MAGVTAVARHIGHQLGTRQVTVRFGVARMESPCFQICGTGVVERRSCRASREQAHPGPPDSGAHLAAAKGLPTAGSTWCAHPLKTGVEIRSLAAYDTALGIVGAKGRWRDGGHEIGDS
jgi:hypothetical protein